MKKPKPFRLNLLVLAASVSFSGVALTASVDGVLKTGESKTAQAVVSQQRIDKTADETEKLLSKFKTVNKEIEGLRVYNQQLDKQISNQQVVIDELEQSIKDVTVIERQLQPLILKMLDSLEQFVELDVPFHRQEREERIAMLRNNMERADISVAEKFRQVLEAYRIESEYGRKIDAYEDTLEVDGQPREVNVLRVGRIALLYQTKDTQLSGAWDQAQRQWVSLDSGAYRSAIQKGLRIANKQASIDIMNLPIAAPEEAAQ